MTQRLQLRLVFSNSKKPLKIGTLPSAARKKSPDNSSLSFFQRQAGRLEKENPEAARLIAQLVNDALDRIHVAAPPLVPWAPLE